MSGPDDKVAAVAEQLARFASGDGVRSAVVKTLGDPQLHVAAQADRILPAASLAKMILGVALFEAEERGEIDLDARVRVGYLKPTRYPSVLQSLDPESTLTVRELCGFSLATSDNPAAEYVRQLLGQDRIDETIRDRQLSATTMPAGFSERELGPLGRSNTTTADDMLRLVEYIDQAPHLGPMRRYLVNNLRNDRIPARLDDDIPVRHKTGSLHGVVNDGGIVLHPTVPIAMIFLTDGQTDSVRTAREISQVAERIVQIVTQL